MLKSLAQDPALSVAKARGVVLQVHLSALWLPALAIVAGSFGESGSLRGAIFMGLFVLLLNGCAMLHELGHIVPATQFGARVSQVRLSGLGAFVRVETSTPVRAKHELVIALGGPLVSATMAGAFGALAVLAIEPKTVADWGAALGRRDGAAMLLVLAGTNLLLTAFNLLPILPMDGGRALTAFLAIFYSRPAAARMVNSFNQIMAVVTAAATAYLTHVTFLRLAALMAGGLVILFRFREVERAKSRPLH